MNIKKETSAPTMKDVAKEAGVALGTVSKVVNGLPVGESYRVRVEDAIRKLNYQVNSYAQGLKVKNARLVANPGCYTTCSILTAYPLVKEGLIDTDTLIIDAKSGTSGAGRSAKVANLYCEVNENIKAYNVAGHRHTPEIEEQLGYAAGKEIMLNFTPHLVPMNRGILVTEYAKLKLVKKADGSSGLPSYEEIKAVYDRYYGKEKFVRVLEKGVYPETKWVEGSNYVDVNFVIDERTGRIIMMGALDNLVKGAAGQAVQNMNLMFGVKESEGLELIPMFP